MLKKHVLKILLLLALTGLSSATIYSDTELNDKNIDFRNVRQNVHYFNQFFEIDNPITDFTGFYFYSKNQEGRTLANTANSTLLVYQAYYWINFNNAIYANFGRQTLFDRLLAEQGFTTMEGVKFGYHDKNMLIGFFDKLEVGNGKTIQPFIDNTNTILTYVKFSPIAIPLLDYDLYYIVREHQDSYASGNETTQTKKIGAQFNTDLFDTQITYRVVQNNPNIDLLVKNLGSSTITEINPTFDNKPLEKYLSVFKKMDNFNLEYVYRDDTPHIEENSIYSTFKFAYQDITSQKLSIGWNDILNTDFSVGYEIINQAYGNPSYVNASFNTLVSNEISHNADVSVISIAGTIRNLPLNLTLGGYVELETSGKDYANDIYYLYAKQDVLDNLNLTYAYSYGFLDSTTQLTQYRYASCSLLCNYQAFDFLNLNAEIRYDLTEPEHPELENNPIDYRLGVGIKL